jgi:UDP-N-acetylglucosamine 2-epimerase
MCRIIVWPRRNTAREAMTLKILTIVGARPQFIKAAAVSRAIRATDGLSEVMVHTGQHFDPNMSDVFFEELDIPRPRHHLDIHGGGHGDMTGRMLMAIEPIMLAEKPDWVVVYGDTNSTLAGFSRRRSCIFRSRMSRRDFDRSTAACRRRSIGW